MVKGRHQWSLLAAPNTSVLFPFISARMQLEGTRNFYASSGCRTQGWAQGGSASAFQSPKACESVAVTSSPPGRRPAWHLLLPPFGLLAQDRSCTRAKRHQVTITPKVTVTPGESRALRHQPGLEDLKSLPWEKPRRRAPSSHRSQAWGVCLPCGQRQTEPAAASQSPPAETGTSPRRGAAAPVQPAAIASRCLALAFRSASVPEVLPAFQKMQKMRPPRRREENKYRTGQTLSQKQTCQLGGWKRCLKRQVATE